MSREPYEQILVLKDDIKDMFESSGFECVDGSDLHWFEECDDESAYIHPSFKSETMAPIDLAKAIKDVDRKVTDFDIPLKMTMVCHLPGDFMFLVRLA